MKYRVQFLNCLAFLSFGVFLCCPVFAADAAHWPSELAQREHSFRILGAAIAREPGFPLTGTDAQKANYLFSRWPDVVDHYSLTAGTGSRPSDLAIWALRLADGADVDGNASLKSLVGRGNCAEFTYAFQDVLKGAGVESRAMFADDNPSDGASPDFTGTDTALFVDDIGPDGTPVRRVFDAFRATYEHQSAGKKPWSETVKTWGDVPMTDNDKLRRDGDKRVSWNVELEKNWVKDAQTETLLKPLGRSRPLSQVKIEDSWKSVLGVWATKTGTAILIRGQANGQLEGLFYRRSAKSEVQGIPENGYLFRNGTVKLGPPVSLDSKNAFTYKQKGDCPNLAPFTSAECHISFNLTNGTAQIQNKAPLYSVSKCRWAVTSPWDIEVLNTKKE